MTARICCAGLLFCEPVRADETTGWQNLARLREGDAMVQFEAKGEDREARLGLAIALMNLQPKTESNLARAEAMLREVEKSDVQDDAGIAALYFRARLAQVHLLVPNVPEARALYETMIARHPQHLFGQLAVVKLAILNLYAAPATADRAALLQEVSRLGENLTHGPAVRDFHLVLADAYARWQVSDEKSLEHLLATFRSGSLQGKMAGDICLRIGELSRLLGNPAQADEFYRRFLEEFPRDARTFTVRQRLEVSP